MTIIANQCLSPLGGAGYDSPEIKVVNLDVEAGSSVSGNQTEVWVEETFQW